MDEDRAQKVSEIKRRVRQGDYTVDPRAVADAILRRRLEFAAECGQKECSYPERSPDAPMKPTPGGPGRTRPIQVTAGWPRLFGGIQTQSS